MKSLHSQLRVKFTMIAVWSETKVITCFEMRKRISRYGAFLAFVGRSTARAILTVKAAATSKKRIYVTLYYYYCFILLLLCINLYRSLCLQKQQLLNWIPASSNLNSACLKNLKQFLTDIIMWPSSANTSTITVCMVAPLCWGYDVGKTVTS